MNKFAIFPLTTTISVFLFLFLITPQISHSAFVFQSEENSLEISYNRFHLNTTDNLDTAPSAKDAGNMHGARIVYTNYKKESQIHYKFLLEHVENGFSDFKGYNMLTYPQGKTAPERMEVENGFRTYEVQLGVKFRRGLNNLPFDITLYTGYGYHLWQRTFSGEGGSVRFQQEYTWNYVPVGFKLDYNFTSKFSVGLDVTGKLTTKARLRANLKNLAGNGMYIPSNPGSNLGRRVGGRIEIPFLYKTANTRGWSYIVTPWIDIMQTVEKETLVFAAFQNGAPIGDYTWTEPAITRVTTGMALGIYRNF